MLVSLFPDEVTLFVIAHGKENGKERETVELFRFDKKAIALHHTKTIDDPFFKS